MKAVKRRVSDKGIRNLLWKFLRAGVLKEGKIQETLNGTPQGGIISPLLANIYLHELDKYMESNYLHLSAYERRCRRLQGQGNYLYARYADDFVVICNGTKADAIAMKEELRRFLDQLGLKLSEEKTKVTHITEGFSFLGFEILRQIGGRGKMVPMVRIPESAMQRYRHKVREIIAPTTTNESMNAKIIALNRLTRGWCQYYRTTSNPSIVFRKLRPELYQGMAHWLGRKYKLSMPAVHERFYQGSTLGTAKLKLLMPSDIKAKRVLPKTWYNPYTSKEKIERERLLSYEHLWIGYEVAHGRMDLREELILLKGTTCATCGKVLHPSEVEMDHIIPRAKFKDPTEADRIENIQPLCTPCHRAKTKIDSKVLSRMRSKPQVRF